jgi:hypothetical protein
MKLVPPRRCSGGRLPCDVGVAAKAITRLRSRFPRLPDRDAARVVSSDSASVVPPARSLIPYRPRWRWKSGGGKKGRWRTDEKGAQRTGKVAGARPDDARQRTCRRLEQFSVNVHYREELFSVVSIERSRS